MEKYQAYLPVRCNNQPSLDVKKFYGALDIEVLGVDEEDDMFYEVKIPDDMEVVQDGRCWYDMKDKFGNIHFQIFYKRDPWDRDAFITVLDEVRNKLNV